MVKKKKMWIKTGLSNQKYFLEVESTLAQHCSFIVEVADYYRKFFFIIFEFVGPFSCSFYCLKRLCSAFNSVTVSLVFLNYLTIGSKVFMNALTYL